MDQLFSADLLLNATVVAQAGVFGYLWSALIAGIVLILCAYVLPGVHIDSFVSALILGVLVGGIVGIVGMLHPNMGWLGGLVITTLALLVGDKLMESVKLDAWWWALLIAVIVSFLSVLPTFALG